MGSFQKLRYYITLNLTFSGQYKYFGIFDSIMRYYALQVLDQNNNTTFKEIEKLKTKLFTKTLKAYLLKKYI